MEIDDRDLKLMADFIGNRIIGGQVTRVRFECFGTGIVNGIARGYIDTDNTEALRNAPVRNAAILERIPAQRWGTPEDMTGAALFLASSASDYVHGSILTVDGGWMGR